MRVGSLFSGIGGLDLGLERAGMSVVWQCEANPYCRAVLRKRWSDVPCYSDVREIELGHPWPQSPEPVDLLAGGFPCQPVSYAGKGLAQADDRWLWPEFARVVRELRPRYVLVENVPGLLARGMGDVLGDLAACGYDAEWDCIPAAAVGAPHRRDRVWIVAYPNGGGHVHGQARIFATETGLDAFGESQPSGADVAYAHGGRLEVRSQRNGGPQQPGQRTPRRRDADGRRDDVANPESIGRELRPTSRQRPGRSPGSGAGDTSWWATEPDVGRVAHGVPSRVDRLRCLGNAVVPQVAEWIGRRIMSAAACTSQGDDA